MDILRLIGIALCGTAAAVVLRSFGRRDIAVLCEIACGIVLLTMIAGDLRNVVDDLSEWWQKLSPDDALIRLLLKVTGIALLAEFAAQLCRDAGIGTIAQKIELAGKVVILCAALPMLMELVSAALSLLV